MYKNLVIVESPAKTKTISKFLGSSYKVMASNGHVRDLPKSRLGIDVDNDFEPDYITIRGKGEVLAALRKEAKNAENIYLATDPDREGEAISWHLITALNIKGKKVYRITFNEISKTAVKEALRQPTKINQALVDSQQARRILDRLVGYKISPILWVKVKRGLSAGRVQSATLKMVCDREDAINEFIPEEYWTLDVHINIENQKGSLIARYYGSNGKKIVPTSEKEMESIISSLKDTEYKLNDIKASERIKKAPLPFTTSTLQQEAGRVLNFTTQKTMRIAQQLYEGINIKGEGSQGMITYLRTDSTRISEDAAKNATDYIYKNYGEIYNKTKADTYKSIKKIQDAHEAIRPTDINRIPIAVKESLTRDQLRLYQLIWKRFVASRMADAIYDNVSIKIDANDHRFQATASRMKFDGYMKVYNHSEDIDKEDNALLYNLELDSKLQVHQYEPKQHFTQPQPHYTEASLVHDMEKFGIGRPSTYAPTIGTLLGRRYVIKEGKNLFVTALGEAVNTLIVDAFPSIVDVGFTADMEAKLDQVEEGESDFKSIIADFYPDFDNAVNKASEDLERVKVADEYLDELCDKCGKQMVVKYGPHGKFAACSGFPDCRNTKPVYEKLGIECPKCGKDIVLKYTKKGRKYYGCINNPDCDYMIWQKPLKKKCPVCGDPMVMKGKKSVCLRPECRSRLV